MENFGRLSIQTYPQIDIQADLSRQLDKLRQQSPERFPTPIYVPAAVDETVDGQMKERFQQASRDYSGKCIILIPYSLGNFHWIGILIEFIRKEQIKKSQFIDPVKGSDFTPPKLQNQFAEVFPKDTLSSRTLLNHENQTKSAVLTVANLLSAVQNTEFSQRNIQDKGSLETSKSNDKKSNIYLPDEQPQYSSEDEYDFLTPPLDHFKQR